MGEGEMAPVKAVPHIAHRAPRVAEGIMLLVLSMEKGGWSGFELDIF